MLQKYFISPKTFEFSINFHFFHSFISFIPSWFFNWHINSIKWHPISMPLIIFKPPHLNKLMFSWICYTKPFSFEIFVEATFNNASTRSHHPDESGWLIFRIVFTHEGICFAIWISLLDPCCWNECFGIVFV